MFWIHPEHRATFDAAQAGVYEAIADLKPADHFHEKQGRSTGRYVISMPGKRLSFFLKKYYRVPWWQRWLAPLAWYPGPRELANLNRASALGIPVPQALAAGAARHHPCHSMLAVRELEGFEPLHEFIPRRWTGGESAENRRLRRELTHRLAEITRRLHAAHTYHCDLYLCHFFIRTNNLGHITQERDGNLPRIGHTPFDLVLIDFTRLKHSWNPRWRVKDLAQLLFSSDLPGVTRTDRLRFFCRYLGITRLTPSARWLLRWVSSKAERYHHHNRKLQEEGSRQSAVGSRQ
jgi:heptose I phosphotransferase